MARATPLQKPYGTIQKCAVEADRGFTNHGAGDSGFGRPVKRPTRFKDPLKQSALSAGALSAGALSAGALSAGAQSAGALSAGALSAGALSVGALIAGALSARARSAGP